MSQSHSPEEAIFLAALEQGSRQARESYLAAACGGDKALLARVRELLAAHDNDSGPLDLTLPGLKSGTVRETIERPGTQIGPYKLLQVIGEGGMGVVYMASQREPVERTVALKIIKPGMDTRQVVARFEAERQALALMDHPNIARVLDGGSVGTEGLGLGARAREGRSESDRTGSESLALATSPSPSSGRPYFVMELVKGVPITQYCDEHHLTPRQRLELFVPVCQAIQHAHQKGIIHRDIKPTNILVAEYDQRPVPKIIDFGVAKAIGQRLTEKTMFTEFGQVVGTVEYMSPEQAKLNQLDIDTRTDIYSLGVLLYELLSGETPFDRQRLRSAAFDEVLRIIREEEPPRPSTKLSSSHSLPSIAASRHTEPRQLASLLRGELDWIVMKALEKDRNRRYETANGLAMDLMRYLHDEPVLACPPSIGYRVGKFARRNRRSLVTAALFGVLLLGAIGAIASIAGWAARDRTAQRAAAAQRIALDRAERRIVLEREIEAALGEVALEYSHDRLAHAASGQKRAASLWASGASDPALKQRIEQWRIDLQLAQRLDEIRLEQAAVKDGHYARAAADPVYSDAFQEYGLDFDKLADAALASRVQSSAIRDRLIPALDDWLETRLIGQLSGDKLVAVAAAADGDPWRNRLRQASLKSDPKELLALAQDADVLEHPPTSLLLLASLLRGSGQLQAAIALLEQAQQQYPVDFWTNQNLGLYLMQLPMPPAEKAIGYYRAAVTLRPTSPGVRVNLGNALRRLNRRAEAEREYRTALQLKPDYAEAHLNLGTVLFDEGLLEEAEAEFLEALALRKNYAKALANLGNVYQSQDRLIEAEFTCRLAVAIDRDDLFAQLTCGDVLLKRDMYADAEAAYREAVRLDGRVGRHHQALATALRLQGKLDEAAAEFSTAILLDPRLDQSRSGLQSLVGARRTPVEAEAMFRSAVERDPRNANQRMQLAEALASQGKDAAAAAEYREIARLQPANGYARAKMSSLLTRLGKIEELDAAYQELVRARPDEPAIHQEYGYFLSNQGRPSDAERILRAGVARIPSDVGLRLQFAKVLLASGKSADALPELEAAIAARPESGTLHVEYALALTQVGRATEALAEYREGVRLTPASSQYWMHLADALAKSGPATEAEAAYRESLRLDAKNLYCRHSYASFLIAQQRLLDAETELRENLRRAPHYLMSRQSLIDVLRKQGKLAELEPVYRDGVAQQPQEFLRYRELSDYLLSQTRPADAEQVLRDAVAVMPESVAARDHLAKFLDSQGQRPGAEAELRQVLRLNPDDPTLHFRLASLLRQRGQLQDAAAEFREAVRLNPHEPQYSNTLADVLKDLGQPDEAVKVLRELVERRPEDQESLLRLARLLVQLKKREDAEAAFRSAIRLRPMFVGPYFELGGFLHGQGQLEAAEAAFRDLLRIAPGDGNGHERLAGVLISRGQFAEAEGELRQALSLNPESTGVHWGLGNCFQAQGRTDEALAAFQEAIRRQPAEAYPHHQVGKLLLKQGRFQEAEVQLAEAANLRPLDQTIKNDLAAARTKVKLLADEPALRAAVSEKPDDHQARQRLGNLLIALGKFADAEAELRHAVRLAPTQAPYHTNLAQALIQQGKLAEALGEYREAARLQPQVAAHYYAVGNFGGRLAMWNDSAAALLKVTELDPKNHLAWYGLAALRLEMGDVEGYRQASRDMLTRFEGAAQPEIWERTAKTCLLTADGAGELKRALALADRAVTGTEKNRYYWYIQFTKGLSEYRAGRYAESLPWLEKFTGRPQAAGPAEATYAPYYTAGHAVIALTQHRLGEGEKAAAELAAAQNLMVRWMPDGSAARPFELNWDDWLRARMLVREAESALQAAAAEAPQDK